MKVVMASFIVSLLLLLVGVDGIKGDGHMLPSAGRPNIESSRKMGKDSLMRLTSKILSVMKYSSNKVIRVGPVGNSCDVCHATRDQICKDLINRDQQVEIMMWLFDLCEIFQRHVDGCKKFVFEYGPLLLANVYKFMISEDVCQLIHMCAEHTPSEKKADHYLYPRHKEH